MNQSRTRTKNFALLLFLGSLLCAAPAFADTFVYVGSFHVYDAPAVSWTTNPPVYTGQEAAAAIFGGAPANYALSTNGTNPGLINFMNWVDGWGNLSHGGGGGSTPVAQNYDLSQLFDPGHYNCGFTSCSFSALVQDHFVPGVNYVFLDIPAAVPEPGSMLLLGTGLTALVGIMRKKK